MSENGRFALELVRERDYEFTVQFDWQQVQPLLLDEPEPLGAAKGPNASRLLGAAVGNCLSASLLFCLQKSRVAVSDLKTRVEGMLVRNEKGRLRIGRLDVTLRVDFEKAQQPRMDRCLGLFEDYCVVTASVRKGIPVRVVVQDAAGNELYRDDGAHASG